MALKSRMQAIEELTKGQILSYKLCKLLDQPKKMASDLESVNGVVVQIMGMFDNTISILNSSNLNESNYSQTNNVRSLRSWDDQKSEDSSESIKSLIPVKTKRGCYKRRKNVATITKVLSTLTDDGYAWRKYGQKTILNSKYERNYYRCSHKFEKQCHATKQVQRIDGEPSKYKITYNGFHTCNVQSAPEIIVDAPNTNRDNSFIISFGTNTSMEKNKVDTCFSSMKYAPKEGVQPLGHLKREQVSSSDYQTPLDPITHVPLEHMSTISSEIDCEGMISSEIFSSTCSTYDYEIDDIHDFDDLFLTSATS